ncbi:MAG: hypothetical protein JWR37_5949 [Mycobacterium sp.]|nr:hypothetical protein [Mycobacterium sp.]
MDDSTADSDYSAEEDDQLQEEDTLIDRGVDDVLDEGYSPPDRPHPGDRRDPETMDELLAGEEPDPAMQIDDPVDDETEFADGNEVGDQRAGRLVAQDDGLSGDEEEELWSSDVGIDGGAASAEEAAVHIIDDVDDDDK